MGTNRPGPLHTCGVAVVTIAKNAYRRAGDLPSPIGPVTKKLAPIVGPIFYIVQSRWLASLSFTDYQILTVEKVIETVYPPSSYVFDKVDTIVHFSETLPEKFDYVVDNFPTVIQQVPILNWALAQMILLLSLLISTLTDWGVGMNGARYHKEGEKEIMIDINSHDQVATTLDNDSSRHIHENEQQENIETSTDRNGKHIDPNIGTLRDEPMVDVNNNVPVKEANATGGNVKERSEKKEEARESEAEIGMKNEAAKSYKEAVLAMGKKNEGRSYKEVVELGGNHNKEEISEEIKNEDQNLNKNLQDQNQNQNQNQHVVVKDEEEDPVLELFNSGWHMS